MEGQVGVLSEGGGEGAVGGGEGGVDCGGGVGDGGEEGGGEDCCEVLFSMTGQPSKGCLEDGEKWTNDLSCSILGNH